MMKRVILSSMILSAVGLTGCFKKEEPKMPPPGVIVAPVTTNEVAAIQSYVGQVVAYDEVDLVARVEGYLVQRNFEEGTAVKKGDLLFLIEQDNYKAKVDNATALLQEVQANLRDANFEYARHKLLQEKDANSKRDFEQAETNKMTSEAKVLAAKANLATAVLNLQYTEIRAPFDGRMGMAKYSVGNLVNASSGKLATIVKNDLIKVDFYVNEATIATHMQDRVIVNHRNERVVPTLILPNGRKYAEPGKLESLDNKIQDSTGTVLVRAVFPNTGNLLIPGMYVKVLLEGKQKEKVLQIPAAALQEDQEGSYVMVVNDKNIVQQRHVTVDNSQSSMMLPVSKGLQEGERVIVEGLQKVRDGVPVSPTQAGKDGVQAASEQAPAGKKG